MFRKQRNGNRTRPCAGSGARRGPFGGRARPQLECLEDRWLPSLFVPTTFDDGGAGSGSLRAAVLAANADPSSDTAVIRLHAGTYRLTLGNDPATGQENAAATGDLDVTNPGHLLVIRG